MVRHATRGPDVPGRWHAFAVLVPAHDEEPVIAETLDALAAMDYPAERSTSVRVADHCTDRTAELARAAGASPRARRSSRAARARRCAGRSTTCSTAPEPPDVVVVVDADTIVAPGVPRGDRRGRRPRRRVVQGQYRVRDPGESAGAGLRAIALALRHHVRPLGRTTLGGSSGLYGNGMAFTPSVLARPGVEQPPHRGHRAADGAAARRHPRRLRAGRRRRGRDAGDARRRATQNERWERGRLELARRYVPTAAPRPSTQRGRARVAAVDAALDHLVPPLSVLVAAVGAVAVAELVASLSFAPAAGDGLRSCSRLRSSVHVLSGIVLGRVPRSVVPFAAARPAR